MALNKYYVIFEVSDTIAVLGICDSSTDNYGGPYFALQGPPSAVVDRALLPRKPTVEARKLEYDYPPYPHLQKKDNQHKMSQMHIPTFWSLL